MEVSLFAINNQNVRPILSLSTPYPTNPVKIGEYVADNLSQYYNGEGLNRKFNSQKMGGPSELQKQWEILIKYYIRDGKSDAEFESDYFIKLYLEQTYKEYAQTRKTASYGYFQMLYTTAILIEPYGPYYPRQPGNYPAPETMADQDIFMPYVMKFLKYGVKRKLSSDESFDSNNWANGFEQVWLDSYHIYNQRPSYNSEVLTNSTYFLPR